MPGNLQYQFDYSNTGKTGRRKSIQKRILILGDFSGQNPDKPELASRKPYTVDIDTLDAVLRHIAPQLKLSLGDGNEDILIEFTELDDFHPDALYKRLTVFKTLRNMRSRLENPSTYPAAAEELKRGMGETSTEAAKSQPGQAANGNNDLLDRLLGGHSQIAEPRTSLDADKIQSLIQQIVAPHLNKGVDMGQQKQLLSAIDDSVNLLMRTILHHPQFQALEAAWRGIEWLIGNIEDSDEMKICLLDASLDELIDDVKASEGQTNNIAIYRLMTETSLAIPGGIPWSLVVGQYTFGGNAEGLSLLEILGAISAGCGGVFIANASPNLLGCQSIAANPNASDWQQPKADIAQAWKRLRQSQAAQYISLALPRFMLRQPYGKKSNPTEGFRFEEMPSIPVHESYLWGNPSLICAELIARAWLEGEDGEPGTLRETNSLPYHIYDDGSGQTIKPCAEVYLNEKTANAMLETGIIPILSVRNRDIAIVPRLVSIAETAIDIV